MTASRYQSGSFSSGSGFGIGGAVGLASDVPNAAADLV
jgi:hypothetical protein